MERNNTDLLPFRFFHRFQVMAVSMTSLSQDPISFKVYNYLFLPSYSKSKSTYMLGGCGSRKVLYKQIRKNKVFENGSPETRKMIMIGTKLL